MTCVYCEPKSRMIMREGVEVVTSVGAGEFGVRVRGRIVRAIDRDEVTLSGKAALKMLANFLRRRRLRRTSAQNYPESYDQQGFHLEML